MEGAGGGVGPPLQDDAQSHSRVAAGGDHGVGLGEAQGHRFFDQHVLGRPRRRHRLFRVQAARSAQADGVDVGALEQRREARLARHAELRCRFIRSCRVGAADGREPGAGRLCDGASVVAGDHARADDPEADHGVHRLLSRPSVPSSAQRRRVQSRR